MSKSRWANASREDLEALADATERSKCDLSYATCKVLDRLRASCPPLRTEAEVAAEALAILQANADFPLCGPVVARLRALAKEPTRG